MKDNIIITLLFTFVSISSMGQFIPQSTGFSEHFRGLNSISVVNENVVWATAYDGNDSDNRIQEFTKTIDGGETWIPGTINVGSTAVTISQISAVNKDTAWVAVAPNPPTNIKGVFRTVNGGQDWTRQATATYNDASSFPNLVHFWDKNNGFCQGDPIGATGSREFELYTTTDGGITWVVVDGANIADPLYGEWGYTALSYVKGNSIWFGTNAGRIYHSADRGYTWSVAQSPVSDFANFGTTPVNGAFAFTDETNGLLIDNNSKLWETSDAGMTWDEITTATGNHYPTDITAVPGTIGTYVNTGKGDVSGEEVIGGGISYSTDNGYTWYNFPDSIQLTEKAEWLSPTIGWVGTFNIDVATGGIYKFDGTFTSISSSVETIEFNIYPNPSIGVFTIDNVKNHKIEIYNNLGQLIYSKQNSSSSSLIDLSNQNVGNYIVRITSDENTTTKKLIIVK